MFCVKFKGLLQCGTHVSSRRGKIFLFHTTPQYRWGPPVYLLVPDTQQQPRQRRGARLVLDSSSLTACSMRRTAFARAAADGKRARRTSPDRKCSASSWDRSTHSHTAIWLSGSDQTSAVAGAPPPPPPLLLLPAPPSPLTESRMACPVVTTSEISACGGLAQGTYLTAAA